MTLHQVTIGAFIFIKLHCKKINDMKTKSLLFLLFNISLFLFSKNISAKDSIKVELDKILFFESDGNSVNKSDRIYVNCFKPEVKYMVNDKRNTKSYKKIKGKIAFSKSGNIIYKAKIGGDWYVMKADEKKSSAFSKIESISSNSDDSKIAYKAKTGKKWCVYINKDKISPEFDIIGEKIIFNSEGNSVCYVAANDESMFVMLNKKKISRDFKIFHKYSMYFGKSPLAISDLTFNKAGDKVAYLVNYSYKYGDSITKNEEYYVMINDTQISPKIYSGALFSKKPGELFYAGIDISNLILYHIKIDF